MSSKVSNSEPGRKIPAKYEGPVDNLLIAISEKLSPTFKQLNFTPNGITTLSTIFFAGALYNLYQKNTTEFTIYALIAYFFDVMDGYYARKYNMVTEGGDKYDHYKDLVVALSGLWILYSKYNILNFPVLIVVGLVLSFLCLVHIGCQEILTSKSNSSPTLEFTKNISNAMHINKEECKKKIKFYKWFGTGSIVLFIIGAVLYMNGDIDSLLGSLGLGSNTVPGSAELADKLFEEATSSVEDVVSSPSDLTLFSIFGKNRNVVDLRGYNEDLSGNFKQDRQYGKLGLSGQTIDDSFLRELKNFGSAQLSTLESLGSVGSNYSTGTLVDNLIRD